MMRKASLAIFLVLLGVLVSIGAVQAKGDLPDYVIAEFGTPPAIPDGPPPDGVDAALGTIFEGGFTQSVWGADQAAALYEIAETGDPRLAWILADMLRFAWQTEVNNAIAGTAADLLGIKLKGNRAWHQITDHLIAWDVPAFPGYLNHKRKVFTRFVPGWDKILVQGDIDWRLVSWGGVQIDDRPFGTERLCNNCIPAADNPQVSNAADATWLQASDIVFGIVVNGQARAYPRRIMEVREMVNDTLGGRHLGIPYCTLCGAAQAYFTDDLPEGVDRPILRTSGLLIRSNKVTYDVVTNSVFDTFLGYAVTGPLAAKGVKLHQAPVITTEWGAWKAEHPDTTVLVEALALGRDYNFRAGRDAKGPIFPIGDVDPRLPVHEDVLGVVTADGTPVAFQLSKAIAALKSGVDISYQNVHLRLVGSGLKAVDQNGNDLGSHQAFWFAWSQFHPDTALWEG